MTSKQPDSRDGERKCPRCYGEGHVGWVSQYYVEVCPKCGGTGKATKGEHDD